MTVVLRVATGVVLALALAILIAGGCAKASKNAGAPVAGGAAVVSTPTASATTTSPPAAATTENPAPASPTIVAVAGLKPVRASAVQPPADGTLIGVFRPPGPFDRSAMNSYASISPKPAAIVMWYQQWGSHSANRFDSAMAAAVYARGAIPLISWEPWDPGDKPHNLQNPADSPDWRLSTIIDGEHDDYLRSWARAIKALGGPVMLRPMHEMNGNWYPWSGTANGNTPAQYVTAWRHIHDLFQSEGATNVTWVWSVNQLSKPGSADNVYAAYYPGDDYVDWVSTSGFNWGKSIRGVKWDLFDAIFTPALSYLTTLGKPIVIGECATVEQGGDKAAWMTDAYTKLRTEHPQLKAIVYYDALEKGVKHGVQDWRIESSSASARAYRDAVSASYFVGGPAPTLAAWKKGLSAAQRARLASYQRIY